MPNLTNQREYIWATPEKAMYETRSPNLSSDMTVLVAHDAIDIPPVLHFPINRQKH